MGKIDVTKFRILMQKWRDPKYVGDINNINKLADETLKSINSEPLLKNICEIFMYAVSVKAMTEKNIPDHDNINI